MPAGAPAAPPGLFAPDPGKEPLDPVSKLLSDRDPRVEFRTLNIPPLPKEKRPSADRIAVPIVPTDDSVAAEMEAARVLDFL
jgi:hypothetical protein